MSALDIVYGRKGGRVMPFGVTPGMAEMLDDGRMVRVRCSCPAVAFFVEPKKVGAKCSGCGEPQRKIPNEPFARAQE